MNRKAAVSLAATGLLVASLAAGISAPATSAQGAPAEITVDLADRSLGPIYHGGNGALYGLSEPNVPDTNTIIPIKPSHILQKAPNGVQHPSGDALRVSDYFFDAGGQNVQIYMQDYYGRWYYPARTGQQYVDEAVIPQARDVKAYKDAYAAKHPGASADDKFLYVPYNEPEQSPRYPSLNADTATGAASRELFFNDWLLVYDTIKSIDPGAEISGPNLTHYQSTIVSNFVAFCVQHDCLPDVFSWHLLSNRSYNNAAVNLASYRAVEAANAPLYASLYPDRTSPFPLPVDVNEYASTAEIAVGGHLVQDLARYDELKVTGALPYWNTANSYGSLLAGENEPTGAWWLYKWYADMQGDMAKVAVANARADGDTLGDGLYGLSTVNDEKKQVGIVFGGTTGTSRIAFDNVTGHEGSPAFLADARQVHITVWRAGFTGLTGHLAEPQQIVDHNVDVVDGSVTLDVPTELESAYYAIVTPAVDSPSRTTWFHRYEAEDATRTATSDPVNTWPRSNTGRTASNGQYVGGISSPASKVDFSVDVPVSGNYKLDTIESSFSTGDLPAQGGGETAQQRQESELFVKIDDQPSYKLHLRADYSDTQLGMVTQYLDLPAGHHSIAFSEYNQDTGEEGQGAANLDAIELSYNGEPGAKPTYRVEGEFSDYDAAAGLQRSSDVAGFEGAGYIAGYNANASSNAKSRFYLGVQDDGVYDLTVRYFTTNTGKLIIDDDQRPALSVNVSNTNSRWQTAKVRLFLRTGINIIDVRSTATLGLDYIQATPTDEKPIYQIEAEDGTVVGTPAAGDPPLVRSDVFGKYASNGTYVNGITSYDGQQRYLDVPIRVREAGHYRVVVRYANGQYSGTHAYNNNVVERYAQVSVNGGAPKTVYFKNTISWQHFATMPLDVDLKAGPNTIRFSNDNSDDGGANPYGGNNADGTAGFTFLTMVPNQYTPAFDRFDVYALPSLVALNAK